LAVANYDRVSVFLGNRDGTFGGERGFPVGGLVGSLPYSVVVADLNGDGVLDLATANLSTDNVSVLLGRGDGTFAAERRVAAGYQPYSVAVGDFNGDGLLDLAVANSEQLFELGDVGILINNTPQAARSRAPE